MAKNQFSYIELPATDVASLKSFYGNVFGWTHQDWGADYATAHGSGLETGYNGSDEGRAKAPLAMIETDTIEAVADQVEAAGERSRSQFSSIPADAGFTSLILQGMNWQ